MGGVVVLFLNIASLFVVNCTVSRSKSWHCMLESFALGLGWLDRIIWVGWKGG